MQEGRPLENIMEIIFSKGLVNTLLNMDYNYLIG